ncbi:hypothetical protein T02_746 [Trichinella nativa]|uniref:Uncharacterized protein n=1 Tax=Trichinella nativa TaxID=6335 RepID=A0A0V1LRC4_9BILA|nr:hypothetical protein T02_746 [Trichinella nativa]
MASKVLDRVEEPVDFGCPASFVCFVQAFVEVLQRFRVGLVDGQRFPQIVHVFQFLQFRYAHAEHHREQSDEQPTLPVQDQVRFGAESLELFKFFALFHVVGTFGDDAQKVFGQHERYPFPGDAELLFVVAEKVAEVDVKDAAVVGDHDVARMPIADAQHERRHAVSGAGACEPSHSRVVPIVAEVDAASAAHGAMQQGGRADVECADSTFECLNFKNGFRPFDNFDHSYPFTHRQCVVGGQAKVVAFGFPDVVHDAQHLQSQHVLADIVAGFEQNLHTTVRLTGGRFAAPDQQNRPLGRTDHVALVDEQRAQVDRVVEWTVQILQSFGVVSLAQTFPEQLGAVVLFVLDGRVQRRQLLGGVHLADQRFQIVGTAAAAVGFEQQREPPQRRTMLQFDPQQPEEPLPDGAFQKCPPQQELAQIALQERFVLQRLDQVDQIHGQLVVGQAHVQATHRELTHVRVRIFDV